MGFRGFHTVDLFDCPPFQMFTSGDDPVSEMILESRRFEPHSMRLWCQLAREATAILDIGAHVGVYSLAAASLRSDIQIHAFEPNPFVAARLRVNKHLNDFRNIVEHNVAVSRKNTKSELAWIRKAGGWLNSGSALAPPDGDYETALVRVTTIDSFDTTPGAKPLAKIDVEGAELPVLLGMQQFLKSRPTLLLEAFIQSACEQISSMLTEYRFFLVEESGDLIETKTLKARDPHNENKNQLLLPREGCDPRYLSSLSALGPL